LRLALEWHGLSLTEELQLVQSRIDQSLDLIDHVLKLGVLR
jgi:hypothetical protein